MAFRFQILWAVVFACMTGTGAAKDSGNAKRGSIDPSRVAEIAGMLPAAPEPLLLVPASDRTRWNSFPTKEAAKILKNAEGILKDGLPPWSDDTYLEYSKIGKRTNGDRMNLGRSDALQALVLAECLEYKGRFIPPICQALESLASDKSWTLPSHDYGLVNFKGQSMVVELASARRALIFTAALCMLENKLPEPTRRLVRDTLEKRIFAPFRNHLKTGAPPAGKRFFWLTGSNNWNPVCHAGVVLSALSVIENREERAFYVHAAELGLPAYLAGTGADGYCSEGIGYWGYGFGNYALLALGVREATRGKIDWFNNPKVAAMGSFGRRMELMPGIYPAYADCKPTATPSQWLVNFMDRLYASNPAKDNEIPASAFSDPQALCQNLFPDSPCMSTKPVSGITLPKGDSLRSFFNLAGVLNCYPKDRASPDAFAVSLKGGNNNEEHNHNDLGSFVIATPKAKPPIILDPGSEVYTSRTFSKDRYLSKALSSWGHSVPLVAGKQQSPGAKAQAKVIESKFSANQDVFALDLTSAYDQAAGLQALTRTFTYTRSPQVSLTIVDSLTASVPMTFGTALVTYDSWKQTGPNTLVFYRGDEALEVVIDCGNEPPEIHADLINEDMTSKKQPTRVAIHRPAQSAKARISMTIRRVPVPAG